MNYELKIDGGDFFNFKHQIGTTNNNFFRLHYHPYPEIYLFVKGEAKFVIEGAEYNLNPNDIILIPSYTLHQPVVEHSENIERYVFNVYPAFFEIMHCEEYNIFPKLQNFMYKIPGRVVTQSRYLQVIKELRTYSNNFSNMNFPVVYCKLCELLHILNSITYFENFNTQNPVVQGIVDYIDKNFKTFTKIEDLAKQFNYTPNHLGYIFKKGTGMTILNYVLMKKIENTKMLYSKGHSLTYSCLESGFASYNNFSYNYKKIFGVPPKADLK